MDIGEWLRGLGLQQYVTAFRENDVEAEVLLWLRAEDLKDIGVSSVGHRRKLLEAIAELRDGSSPTSAEGVQEPTQVTEIRVGNRITDRCRTPAAHGHVR